MSTKKIQHTAEARDLLAALDADLAGTGAATGDELIWDTNDNEIREAVALTIDRRARLRQLWEQTTDESLLVKLSVELRQVDSAIAKMLKDLQASIEPPEPKSLTSIKASRAAATRWQRERERNARNG
jgi:hypothetical protein